MSKAKPELKALCIRLRVEERFSLREIQEKTGASKGSLSRWLRGHPLTNEELAERQRTRKRGERIGRKKNRGEESTLHAMSRGRPMTKLHTAKVAEAASMLRMCINGFNVFGSVFDGDKTDWLVEIPGTDRIYKIQVKSVQKGRHGLPFADLRCSSGRRSTGVRTSYKEGDFDFIVGYDRYTDICYVWSWGEVAHLKSAVTICPEAEERWDKFLVGVAQ